MKVIPIKSETVAYFAVQQVVLFATLSAAMAGTVCRYRTKKSLDETLQSKKSETGAEFSLTVFVHFVLPVVDLLPSVYIWYDYNMSRELTYDQSILISAVIFGFVFLKVGFLLMRIVLLNTELDSPESTKLRELGKKLLFGGVKGGPLQFILIDSFEPFLLYFYFNRYIAPGEQVKVSSFGVFAVKLFKYGYKMFYVLAVIISKIFRGACSTYLDAYRKISDLSETFSDSSDELCEPPSKLVMTIETIAHLLRRLIEARSYKVFYFKP